MTTAGLVSFYVIACNQERLVAEAVAGALAQTWSPLEVVLSDDCSDDNTFAVMQDAARAYRGPHRVALNRTEKRLGIGAHINRVLGLCSGEWIVASAGDDVSLPDRTARLRAAWESDNRHAGLVYSNLLEMNEDGTDRALLDFRHELPAGRQRWDYRDRLAGCRLPVHGAGFAYPRRTFTDFGPFREGIVFEDNVLNWRAELTGGVLLCPEPLVRHRNHSGQITNLHSRQALRDADNRRRRLHWSDVVTRRQNLADARIALERGWIDAAAHREAEKILSERLRDEERDYQLFWGGFGQRWRLLSDQSARRGKRPTQLLFAAMPRPVYLAALRAVTAFR